MFEFLEEMQRYCELVIFTAATKDYADVILDCLEIRKPYFDFRLYRQHTSFHGISLVKDLSWIGRDLRKVVIIDNIAENFKLQYMNGLHIKTWIGDIKDEEFLFLKEHLSKIFHSRTQNILPYIKALKDGYKKQNGTYALIDLNIKD